LRQAAEVEKVKKFERGMISDAITVAPDQKISEAREIMQKYGISGLPVTQKGRLVGILTNRDLRFEKRLDRAVAEVMTKENLVTAKPGVNLDEAKEILHQHRIEKLLVIDEHLQLKGLITVKDIEKKSQYPNACKDERGRLRVGAAVGVGSDWEERVEVLVRAGADLIAVDTANRMQHDASGIYRDGNIYTLTGALWETPLNVTLRGRSIPLASVLGGLGTGVAFLVVTVLNVETLVAGTIWLTLGMTIYVAYRRRLGLTLTETRKIVLPKPIVEHEVEYESVLVVFDEGRYSPEAMSTAVQLAARRRRGLHVLVPIAVPPHLPIDAPIPEEERRAQAAIDRARLRGGRRVSGHWEKVRPGGTGRRIVDEAKTIKARAIVIEMPPRRAGSTVFGKTLETVLAERPCRVIITSSRGSEPARVAA
jgi:CBS domain-containing protein